MAMMYWKSCVGLPEVSDKSVRLIVTSPPYSVDASWRQFFAPLLGAWPRVLRPDGYIVLAHRDYRFGGQVVPRHIHYFLMLTELGFILLDEKVWVLGEYANSFRLQHAHIMVYGRPGTKTRKRDSVWMRSVWNIPHPLHTETFAIQIPWRCVEFLTDPGDLVLDPFAGQGTTIVAAEALGRVGVGYEIDPNRWREAYRKLALGYNVKPVESE